MEEIILGGDGRPTANPSGPEQGLLDARDVATEWIPPEVMSRCHRKAIEGRELKGHAELVNGHPVLCIFTRHELRAERGRALLPWVWEDTLGASVTITAFLAEQSARVLLPTGHEVLEPLALGYFTVILFGPKLLVRAQQVDIRNDEVLLRGFAAQMYRCISYRTTFTCPRAHSIQMLKQAMGMWPKLHFSREERAAVGWLPFFEFNADDKVRHLGHLAALLVSRDLAELPENIRESFASYAATADFGVLMRAAGSVSRERNVFDWYNAAEFLSGHDGWKEFEHLVTGAQLMYFQSAEATQDGTRLPGLSGLGGLMDYIEIDLKEIEERCGLQEYWRRQACWLRLNYRLLVDGTDVPVEPDIFMSSADILPAADDLAAVEHSIGALLDEAVQSKQWTIPPDARVALPVGPFVEVQLQELMGDVCIALRTREGEYFYVGLEPAKRYWEFRPMFVDDFDEDRAVRITAAVKMLLAAVVRDFWVVEERESTFAVRREVRRRRRDRKDETRIVYLPRVRYLERPDTERCGSDLGYEATDQREHKVSPHLRKAARASAAQQELARLYGFSVPKGYTFVRPHQRGIQARDVIYRSRSALRSLYAIDETLPATGVRWFEFERDVRRLMLALGFDVEHVAASRRGDRGVDVYATKRPGDVEESWVIQCKCWSAQRKVGPSVIRELIGALAPYPAGTRGMVVTTSSFTSAAKELAEANAVRLMDGEAFVGAGRESPPS